MERDACLRHEVKFMISYADYLAVRSRLKTVCAPDPHATADGSYRIRSIYFDNCEDKALREKEDGAAKREKFRVRYYNDDLSFISLEKKMKIDSLTLKYTSRITEEAFRRLLNGDLDWMKDDPGAPVRELYAKMSYQRLMPKVMTSYRREPFIYPAGNVRVTFDSEIRTSLFTKAFLSPGVACVSATDAPQDLIMEVKYDAFLPQLIRDLIALPGVRQLAFSKYTACRRFG